MIREVTNVRDWQEIVGNNLEMSFLQSWNWGEFQSAVGHQVIRLHVETEGKIFCIQGFCHKLGLGWSYVYFPRILLPSSAYREIFSYLREAGFSFARFEPIVKPNLSEPSGWTIMRTYNRQPPETLLLDLKPSEEDILKQMHSKTRYNIRLAERKGVEIQENKDVNVFWRLNQATAARDKFKSHDQDYYAKMLEQPMVHQLTAYYNNEPVVSNLYVIYGGTGVYLHGAFSSERREVMASYFLQWRGMRLAKKFGCRVYDFWGIAPKVTAGSPESICFNNFCWNVNHQWSGVTRFKVGFGGELETYPEAFDVALSSSKYKIYQLAKKMLGNRRCGNKMIR